MGRYGARRTTRTRTWWGSIWCRAAACSAAPPRSASARLPCLLRASLLTASLLRASPPHGRALGAQGGAALGGAPPRLPLGHCLRCSLPRVLAASGARVAHRLQSQRRHCLRPCRRECMLSEPTVQTRTVSLRGEQWYHFELLHHQARQHTPHQRTPSTLTGPSGARFRSMGHALSNVVPAFTDSLPRPHTTAGLRGQPQARGTAQLPR